MSRSPKTASRHIRAAAVVALGLACPALAAGASTETDGVQVSFGEGCGSAVVSTVDEVSELVTVFSDQRHERIGELPRAASYIVRVSPDAVESGLTISMLYVQSGGTAPGGSGDARILKAAQRFECHAGPPAKRDTSGHRAAIGRPAG